MDLAQHLSKIARLVQDIGLAESEDVRLATNYLLVHEEALLTRALGRLDALDHAEATARVMLAEQAASLERGAPEDRARAQRISTNLQWALLQIAAVRRMWGARLAQGETLWDLEERTQAGRSASDAILRILKRD